MPTPVALGCRAVFESKDGTEVASGFGTGESSELASALILMLQVGRASQTQSFPLGSSSLVDAPSDTTADIQIADFQGTHMPLRFKGGRLR